MNDDYLICDEALNPIYRIDKALFQKMVDTFQSLKKMGMLKSQEKEVIRDYVPKEIKEKEV